MSLFVRILSLFLVSVLSLSSFAKEPQKKKKEEFVVTATGGLAQVESELNDNPGGARVDWSLGGHAKYRISGANGTFGGFKANTEWKLSPVETSSTSISNAALFSNSNSNTYRGNQIKGHDFSVELNLGQNYKSSIKNVNAYSQVNLKYDETKIAPEANVNFPVQKVQVSTLEFAPVGVHAEKAFNQKYFDLYLAPVIGGNLVNVNTTTGEHSLMAATVGVNADLKSNVADLALRYELPVWNSSYYKELMVKLALKANERLSLNVFVSNKQVKILGVTNETSGSQTSFGGGISYNLEK